MNPHVKAKLVDALQGWLDDEDVADSLGGDYGIWQDTTSKQQNAKIYADAVEVAIRSAVLQNELEQADKIENLDD